MQKDIHRQSIKYSILISIALFLVFSCQGPNKSINISELDLSRVQCDEDITRQNRSVAETPLSIAGTIYDTGIGTKAESKMLILLNGQGRNFTAFTGVDDASADDAAIQFYVLGDQNVLWESGIMKKGDAAQKVEINIRGIHKLGMLVTGGDNGSENGYADWTDARITYRGEQPKAIDNLYLRETEELLTPAPSATPRINGPKIYGVRAGSPFLFRIPATGERPIIFSVNNLPEGLVLDPNTGIISGSTIQEGEHLIEITVQNVHGSDSRMFKIAVGNKLALTPPMGWNSWYIYYHRVSDSVMRVAADQMISSGMADFGYQYVNIDDCWAIRDNSDDPVIGGAMREKNGEIRTNKRFPDMKALTDYIHQKGLKAGIYTSPGPKTCAGYAGSYGHEAQDIQTFAGWGFDFLKYDWCYYGRVEKERSREACMKPYLLMWKELQKVDRDIVHNLCQYGMADVWEWGSTTGHCWRTTGDLGILAGSSMPPFYYIGLSNSEHWEYAGPGGWNDPDYILIGWIRNALKAEEYEKTGLTPNEQYAYMSMWSLMAAPLIYSGDMSRLDPFTLNVLCNHEVIDIDQDILGRQAQIIRKDKEELVMVKELEGGAKAVGLFHVSGDANTQNLDLVDGDADGMSDVDRSQDPADQFVWDNRPAPKMISFRASEVNMSGKFKVRDMWRQKDLGIYENSFETPVPFHGVVFLRVSEVNE